MANDFFNWPTSGSRFVNFNVLTGDDLNTALDSVSTGLDKLPTPAKVNGGYANYATATGSANAYVVALSAQITALADGLAVRFKANAANTGAATVNVNSLGAKAIVRPSGAALEASDIANGQIVEVCYDSTNDRFQLQALVSGAAAPATTFSGTAGGTIDLLTGAAIASASTINLTSATGNLIHITGTTTITAVTLVKGPRTVIFDGALTLTHHATNNSLPGAANITTAAGDRATYWSDGTTVYCIEYVKASGAPLIVATQAQMEAASVTTVPVTPGSVNWHPGVAKAWIKCDAAGAIAASHNVTSITDDGTGLVTVTIATDFSSANYVIHACASGPNNGSPRFAFVVDSSIAAGVFQAACNIGSASTLTDPLAWFFACFGDQA